MNPSISDKAILHSEAVVLSRMEAANLSQNTVAKYPAGGCQPTPGAALDCLA